MTDLERRHRKATSRMTRWLSAANNARAMGEVATLHGRGSELVLMAERCLTAMAVPACGLPHCEPCTLAWEMAAHNVEVLARNHGVDPARHTFSAVLAMAERMEHAPHPG